MVQGSHLPCILLPLLPTELHRILLRLIQVLIGLDKLVDLLRRLNQFLVLFTLRLQLLLFLDGCLQLLDRLIELHHVGMRTLVQSFRLRQLLIELLVLFSLDAQICHKLLSLLVIEAVLVNLLEGVALSVLDALQQLDLLLKLLVRAFRCV